MHKLTSSWQNSRHNNFTFYQYCKENQYEYTNMGTSGTNMNILALPV